MDDNVRSSAAPRTTPPRGVSDREASGSFVASAAPAPVDARARQPLAAATAPAAENQEFSQLITGIVEVLDSNAQRIEKAKLKAIGMRNRVLSERENRDQHRRALQAMIAEKTAELERYQTQHQSLSQVEAEQRALVDKLGNSEV
ncbi:hypothetical protein JL720_7219 [Aureococcus anophagefferens]|nr:hypothetical protein JL720_7219 [Aureococcus anophagefferens]